MNQILPSCRKFFLFFFLLFFLAVSGFSQNLDIRLLRDINEHRNTRLDNTFLLFTYSATPIGLMTPISVISTGWATHNTDLTEKGYVMGASMLVSTGIATGLKYIVNRRRPFETYPDIQRSNGTDAGSPSWPSGHTSIAFATATSLSLAFPKWYVIAPSFVWAGAVSYSRMHLGVHYPSDVLAGAIIGTGSSFLCYKAQKWLLK